MLKGVGTEVPKCVEIRKHPCSITWDGACNNNNLCNPIKIKDVWSCVVLSTSNSLHFDYHFGPPGAISASHLVISHL